MKRSTTAVNKRNTSRSGTTRCRLHASTGGSMSQIKRRDVLKAGAVGTVALGFPGIIRAQQKEIVILGLWDQTGAFADVGPLNDRGMRMALEERGMKILG